MAFMATKKLSRGASKPRPDKYSKKRFGTVSQSVRLTVQENRLVRKAADLEGFSINLWATRTLVAAAKQQIAAAASEQPQP
jgi:hypothetical protein